METAHLLRSPKNAARLLSAIEKAAAEEGTPQSIDELQREVGWAKKRKHNQPAKKESGAADLSRRSLSREAVFQSEFLKDLRYWVTTDNRTAKRVLDLVKDVMRDPFVGIGRPEPLKYLGAGVWSRRVTQEHRLVHMVKEARLEFFNV